MRGLSPVAASGGHSLSQCAGLSLSRPLLLRSTGSRRAGSVVVAHGPSCSRACGILPDQGSNPCPLHWQADSQPLCLQGSPFLIFKTVLLMYNLYLFKVYNPVLFSIFTELCDQHNNLILEHSQHSPKKPVPISNHYPFPALPLPFSTRQPGNRQSTFFLYRFIYSVHFI